MVTTQSVDRSKLSPMLLQYAEVKDSYPNDVVLFRVGDFYEAYFEDAIPMSNYGEIRFTAKRIGSKSSKTKDFSVCDDKKYSVDDILSSELLIPMAGIPYKSLDLYSQKLISAGIRVRIIEQMEDPKNVPKNRLIRREEVQILTPFSKDGNFLSDFSNNYICVIYKDIDYSLCFADVLTGEIFLTSVDSIDCVLNEVVRYNPSEIVLNSDLDILLCSQLLSLNLPFMKTVEDCVYSCNTSLDNILTSFNIPSLDKIKFNSLLELKSLCVLISYIEYTQKKSFSFDVLPTCYTFNNYMSIDMYSRKNLELTESLGTRSDSSLLSILNNCKTSMGSRMLKQWVDKPLLSRSKIEERLSSISELVLDSSLLSDIQSSMYGILDISRIIGRLKLNRSIPRDLVNLRDSLGKLPVLYNYLSKFDSYLLKCLSKDMGTFDDLFFLLCSSLLDDPSGDVRDGHVIKPGYNTSLDTARDMVINSNNYLSSFQDSEVQLTGIKSMRLSNNNGKCTLEVPKAHYSKVPSYYRLEKVLKNSSRYVTDESERLERELFSAVSRSKSIELSLYEELKDSILSESKKILELCDIISTFDCLCSLASSAITHNYTCPKLNNDGYLSIESGRHPVVEVLLPDSYISNPTQMNMSDSNFILLTGPNMAGKSTYMRQIALITIMAHVGSFVPASYADICITDKIFTRIGASDDISSGRSTYMVEMIEVKNILDNATKKSLVLLDEVGRGTSTSDGLSIAQSVSEYIYTHVGCKTLFATHYHELISLENSLPGLKNYHMTVEKLDNSLNFSRKLVSGGLSESYGIDVANLAGLPCSVIERARVILNSIDGNKSIPLLIDTSESDLFLSKLKTLDRTNITPVTAYKVLNDLLNILN